MTLNKSIVLSGAAPYLGGKKRLAGILSEIIAKIPHEIYAEPFVGMGGMFFRRHKVPQHEVINDINSEVVNFFRMVQHHAPELLRVLRLSFSSRALYQLALKTPPEMLTEIERAARFYYVQRNSFGGKIVGQAFGVDKHRSRFNIRQLKKHVIALHKRLATTMVECLPYTDFIRRYDTPETLFYLDPPYWGGENDYGKNIFSREDYAKIAQQLAGIKGRFLLSLNDVPQVREVFAAFNFTQVETVYSISSNNQKAAELIISNVRW